MFLYHIASDNRCESKSNVHESTYRFEIVPYIQNGDINLYYEQEKRGDSLTIIFVHGYLGSNLTWKQIGYLRQVQKFSTLVFDRRGYGQSSKPIDPAQYTMKEKCSDIIALMDNIELSQAVVWGFSGGGRITYGMMKYHPDRLSAAIIGGMSPYTLPPEYDMNHRIKLLDEGMDSVLDNFQEMYGTQPASIRENLMKNDPEAIKADVVASKDFEGFAGDLQFFDTPLMLYAGTEDPFFEGCKRASKVIPNCRFLALEGLGHYETLVKTRRFLPEILDFLKKI